MTIYIVFSIFLFFLSISKLSLTQYSKTYTNIQYNNKSGNWLIYCLCLCLVTFLIFISGVRDFSVGNDTRNYIYFFEEFGVKHFVSLNHRTEIGYQLFNFFIGLFTSDPHVYLLIYSLICYSLLYRYICKKCLNIPLALSIVFFVFFTVYANEMRQGLAMVIILYAYDFLKRRKNIISLFLILIAGLIHSSAFICLLLYGFKFVSRNKMYILIILILSLLISLSGVPEMIISHFFPQYIDYFTSKYHYGGSIAIPFYLMGAIVLIFISYNSLCKKWDRASKIEYCNLLLLLICYSLSFSLNLFARAGEYFLLIGLLNISNLISVKKDRRKYTMLFLTILISYFFIIAILRPEWNGITPYKFFWQ